MRPKDNVKGRSKVKSTSDDKNIISVEQGPEAGNVCFILPLQNITCFSKLNKIYCIFINTLQSTVLLVSNWELCEVISISCNFILLMWTYFPFYSISM